MEGKPDSEARARGGRSPLSVGRALREGSEVAGHRLRSDSEDRWLAPVVGSSCISRWVPVSVCTKRQTQALRHTAPQPRPRRRLGLHALHRATASLTRLRTFRTSRDRPLAARWCSRAPVKYPFRTPGSVDSREGAPDPVAYVVRTWTRRGEAAQAGGGMHNSQKGHSSGNKKQVCSHIDGRWSTVEQEPREPCAKNTAAQLRRTSTASGTETQLEGGKVHGSLPAEKSRPLPMKSNLPSPPPHTGFSPKSALVELGWDAFLPYVFMSPRSWSPLPVPAVGDFTDRQKVSLPLAVTIMAWSCQRFCRSASAEPYYVCGSA
jgi:hypothetical protein